MLYISDLDGTLLRNNATLSPYSIVTLSNLIQQGAAFTIATARSIVSVKPLLQELPIKLPVICANGAYLADLATGQRSDIQLINGKLGEELMSLVRKHHMHVFVVTYRMDSGEERVFLEGADNPLIRYHFNPERRKRDSRIREIRNVESVLEENMLNINVMAPLAKMLEFREALRQELGTRVMPYFYEAEHQDGWYWMSVYHGASTKGNAIRRLAQEIGTLPSDLVVFGDQINDFSMFEVAGTAIAMENAHPELKLLATHVIGTNETDSVVRYVSESILSGSKQES